ncbi:MAG: cytochrome c [Vicinamibacterales bacterium]
MRIAIVIAALVSLGAGGVPASARIADQSRRPVAAPAAPSATIWDGVYTVGQAKRGSVQSERCGRCHGAYLEGDFAPPLVGPDFVRKWDGKSLGELFELIESNFAAMNEKEHAFDPDTLSRQQSADFLAYLLIQSRFPGGPTELPVSLEQLRQIRFQASKQ